MVVNVLGENDRLSLVFFRSISSNVYELTKMDEKGKKTAIEKIDELKKKKNNNIYEGIKMAIDIVEKRKDKSRNPSVLFFTDG